MYETVEDQELIKNAILMLEELENRKLINKSTFKDDANKIILIQYSILPAQKLLAKAATKRNKLNFDKHLDQFEIFYNTYPETKKTKGEKDKALNHWIKLIQTGVDPQNILNGLSNYKKFLTTKEKGYTIYFVTNFLFKKYYEQYMNYQVSSNVDQRNSNKYDEL